MTAANARDPQPRFWLGPRAVRAWLLVAGCVALIWTASGESFSTDSTSRFLGPLLRWLFGDVSNETVRTLHWGLRRCAHLVEYGLLGVLSYRALRISIRLPMLRHGLAALLMVSAVAASDEARQSRTASRSGKLSDVGLDFAGGLGGVAVAAWLRRRPGLERFFPAAPPRSD